MFFCRTRLVGAAVLVAAFAARADSDVYLLGTPDYDWFAGCFGTATGNLIGYWDRHGFPDFYTGPTGGGLAPLDNFGINYGIRSLWASSTNYDNRPANRPGHMDDYYDSYESTLPDPYARAGRPEHTPDCIGDFIGLNQRKFTNQNGECDGNIDAYSFVYWDTNGNRRVNYTPTNAGAATVDIQSGLRAWTRYRGYDADVFTQLVDFNPHVPAGHGFTYEDLKKEIDAGYPVLFFLQPNEQLYRSLPGAAKANPEIHGIMAYGYVDRPGEGIVQGVRVRTSWASGDYRFTEWGALFTLIELQGAGVASFPVRGVIGYHPRPKITRVTRIEGNVTLTWDGPGSQIHDDIAGTNGTVHLYQLQRATSLFPSNWQNLDTPTTNRVVTFPEATDQSVFYRLRLLHPGETP
jgi:hypothetical protein